MTQAQLARALDITVRAVKYIEAGQRIPRRSTDERFRALVELHKQAAVVSRPQFSRLQWTV
jgi:transcriptional regulator with XRE-family HTH domain